MDGKALTRIEFAALDLVGRIGEVYQGWEGWRGRIKGIKGTGNSHGSLALLFEESETVWHCRFKDFRHRETWNWTLVEKPPDCLLDDHDIDGRAGNFPIEIFPDGTISARLKTFQSGLQIRPAGEELDPTKKK